ncbi:putative nucleoporin [Helianthus anomalus]
MLLQWPPLVEVVDSRELPSVLIQRYNAVGGEDTALCEIFPEIRRAWAILSDGRKMYLTTTSGTFANNLQKPSEDHMELSVGCG